MKIIKLLKRLALGTGLTVSYTLLGDICDICGGNHATERHDVTCFDCKKEKAVSDICPQCHRCYSCFGLMEKPDGWGNDVCSVCQGITCDICNSHHKTEFHNNACNKCEKIKQYLCPNCKHCIDCGHEPHCLSRDIR